MASVSGSSSSSSSRKYVTRRRVRAGEAAIDADGAQGNPDISVADYWRSPAARGAWGVVEVDRHAVPGGRKVIATPLVWGFASAAEAALYGAIVTRVYAAYTNVPVHKAPRVVVPFSAPPCTVEVFGARLALPADGGGDGGGGSLVVTCDTQTMREAATLFEDAYVPHVEDECRALVDRLHRQHRQKERHLVDEPAALGVLAAQHARLEDAAAARALEDVADDRAALHMLQQRVRAVVPTLPTGFTSRTRQGLLLPLLRTAGPQPSLADADAMDIDADSARLSNDGDDDDDDDVGVPALLDPDEEAEEMRLIDEEERFAVEEETRMAADAAHEAAERLAEKARLAAAKKRAQKAAGPLLEPTLAAAKSDDLSNDPDGLFTL